MRWSGLCFAAILLVTNTASAEVDPDLDGSPPKVSPLRRTGAILLALGPGLVLRGVGSFTVGEKRTAKKLAKIGLTGASGAAVGGLAIGLTGGYPPTLPLLPVLLVGGGLFFTSWWTDIAVAANLQKLSPGRARATPPWSVELSTLWLKDPFRTAGLGRLAGRIDSGKLGVGLAGMIDAENEIRAGDAELRYRILGAAPTGNPIDDGSRLVVRTGVRTHTDDNDGVTLITGEVELLWRYDLFRLDRTLRGTFMQLSTGFGVERADFSSGHDYNDIFLATFGWGVYLGNRGEAAIYYDHRRDTMIGGLPAYRASGFVGSVGTYVDWMLDRRVGARLQIDWGNALVTTFGLRVQGAKP